LDLRFSVAEETRGFTLSHLRFSVCLPRFAAQTAYSRTSPAPGREQDVINRCQTILDLGNANAAALDAKYNVSAKDLQSLKTAIANFTLAQSKPRNGVAVSAAATAEIAALFG
jgi:hypothetical protein